VRTLPEGDASALLDFVAELHDLDESLPFPPRLLASLARLIPSCEVWYGDLDPLAKCSLVHVWHHLDGEEGIVFGDDDYWDDPGDRALFWRVRDSHPICAYRVASGDWTTPCKVSDFATLREYRRTPFYTAFENDPTKYMLQVGLAATPTRYQHFVFCRVNNDFEEGDRLVLSLLRPHLVARAEAVATAVDAAEALVAVEEAGGCEARLVVLCSGKGVIEYASPASRALLARYLGVENGTVPAEVIARRELLVTRNGGRLQVRVARTGGLHVLLLDEQDLRVEKLTAREREVVERVAFGQDNDAIAVELAIAPRTVAKHLERVYRKLGVTNRTAAAATLRRA
jgi:DNA-binding NarL/FixJ family response regulator